MSDLIDNDSDELQGVPESLKERLLDMKSKLDEIEQIAKQIESKPIKDLETELTPIEMAKLNWVSIYAINSLFFVYLKNHGVKLIDHPIMVELSRIKNYMTRINEIVQAEELKNKNTLRIDKESSARIIKRSLWANATNKNKKVSDLVNSTIESAIESNQQNNKRISDEQSIEKPNKKVKFESDSD